MIIRNYDGTLNGLYDIVWQMSDKIKELEERLEMVEGETIKKEEENDDKDQTPLLHHPQWP